MRKVIRVVNLNKSPYDVYIGRGSDFGNPFVIDVDGTRSEVIAKYEKYIMSKPELFDKLPTLKGKTLGCYCKPKACHGDVLKRLCDTHFPEALELVP